MTYSGENNVTPVHLVASWMMNYLCFLGIEKDAVTIFTKYISPDAVRPIPITEQIRNDIVGKTLSPGICIFRHQIFTISVNHF